MTQTEKAIANIIASDINMTLPVSDYQELVKDGISTGDLAKAKKILASLVIDNGYMINVLNKEVPHFKFFDGDTQMSIAKAISEVSGVIGIRE